MIRPSNYAIIWSDSDWLYAELSTPTPDKTYTVKFPNSVEGMSRLLAMLKARTEESLIAGKGSLTQWQIDLEALKKPNYFYEERRVRRLKPTSSPSLREAAKDALRKVGIL